MQEQSERRKKRMKLTLAVLSAVAGVITIAQFFVGDGILRGNSTVNIGNLQEVGEHVGDQVVSRLKPSDTKNNNATQSTTLSQAKEMLSQKYRHLADSLNRGRFEAYLDFFPEECFWVSKDGITVTKATYRTELEDFLPGTASTMAIRIEPKWSSLKEAGPGDVEVNCYRKITFHLDSGLSSNLEEYCTDRWELQDGQASVVSVLDVKARVLEKLFGKRNDGINPLWRDPSH